MRTTVGLALWENIEYINIGNLKGQHVFLLHYYVKIYSLTIHRDVHYQNNVYH